MPTTPHLSDRVRVGRLVLLASLWVGLTGGLVGVGEVVVHAPAVSHLDHRVTAWVVARRGPALDAAMRLVTWAGSWLAVALVVAVAGALVAARRLPPRVLVLAALGWAGEVAGVNIAKAVVERRRPPEPLWLVHADGSSFPSGHAANATLAFVFVVVVVSELAASRPVRIGTTALAVAGVATVAFSRVELGVHWTTDVLLGAVASGCWLMTVLAIGPSTWTPAGGAREPVDGARPPAHRGPVPSGDHDGPRTGHLPGTRRSDMGE